MPTISWSISDFLPSSSWLPSRRSAASISAVQPDQLLDRGLHRRVALDARACADSRNSSSIGTAGAARLRRATTSATATAATSARTTTSPTPPTGLPSQCLSRVTFREDAIDRKPGV